MGRAIIDMAGRQIGKLTVLEIDLDYPKDHNIKSKKKYWKCQCSCGRTTTVLGTALRNKKKPTISCGCARKDAAQEKIIDYSGKTIGRLTVIEPTDKRVDGKVVWRCACACGKEHFVSSAHLQKEDILSCGCLKDEIAIETLNKYRPDNSLDLLNQRFGRLVVVERTEERSSNQSIIWKCKCDCGNDHFVRTDDLTCGKVQSCGCINYSIGEANIVQVLLDNKIEFEKEKTFADLRYQDTQKQPRYDFYLPKYNRLIEFDGEQHYKERTDSPWLHDTSFAIRKQRDILKNVYALSHNISLVRIPYWERDKITLDLLLGDKYLIKDDSAV